MKTPLHFFTVLLLSCSFILLQSCQNDVPKPDLPLENNNVETPAPTPPSYTVETVESETGWGYHILMNGKVYIKQPNIPSIPGNRGFDSQEKAQKVANFILNKIQNGIMPPSTNKMELDSLGVL